VTPVVMPGLDRRGIGTQGVCGDDDLEMRVILAQLGDEAFGGMACAIVLLRAVLLDNRCRHERNHLSLSRLNHWLPGREAHPEVV
jgi:hypothetical protein